jgi:hypothetical protein
MAAIATGRSPRLIVLGLLLYVAGGCRAPEHKRPPVVVRPQERLVVAGLLPTGKHDTAIGTLAEKEQARLRKLCGTPWPNRDGCVTRNLRPTHYRLSLLHGEPRAGSTIVGTIYAVLRPLSAEYEMFRVGLDVEFTHQRGRFHPWIDDVGDWGYGITLDGEVRISGDWAQLLSPVMSVEAWIPVHAQDLLLIVSPLAGHIVDLEPFRATAPDGTSIVITSTSYLVTRVAGDVVEFREEIPSDFACGDDPGPPAVMPPILRAEPAAFFAADGRPRFSTTYTKGC